LKNEQTKIQRLKTVKEQHDNGNRFVLVATFKTNLENVFSKQFKKRPDQQHNNIEGK